MNHNGYTNGSAASSRYTPTQYQYAPQYANGPQRVDQYASAGGATYHHDPYYNRSNTNIRPEETTYYEDERISRRHQRHGPSRSPSQSSYDSSSSDDRDSRRSHRHKQRARSRSKSRSGSGGGMLSIFKNESNSKSTSALPHLPKNIAGNIRDEKHPGLAILAASTGAAAVAAADKYLVHGEKKQESTVRLLADAAMGGILGYGAYKYWDSNYGPEDEDEKRAKKEKKRRERREREDDGDGQMVRRRRSYDEGAQYYGDDRRGERW